MLVVEDLGSPADDRCANEGYTDVDQDGKPLNPPHSQSRMSRRTPSQILGGTPSTTNMITDFELDVTPKSHYGPRPNMPFRGGQLDPSVIEEVPNMILLFVLYMLQGVPLGLTFGTIPMLLASTASYTQIGLFSMAAYPYSIKLLWSPIVDSFYSASFGRRKSWLVPLQLTSAAVMAAFAPFVEAHIAAANVPAVSGLFFILVLLAATQDIAVDGWALTLLSKRHVGYASTCQTVGMNFGYFTSITIFLALNDANFCNRFLRAADSPSSDGLVSLTLYMRFWSFAYAVVTAVVWAVKRERPPAPSEDSSPEGIVAAYTQLWGVVKLPAVVRLSGILVSMRLAFLCVESIASLKLIEKGVAKETMALLVLFQFPCELLSAVVAGRWSASGSPFIPWEVGYILRLIAGMIATTMVLNFPAGAADFSDHPPAFLAVLGAGLLTSFSSTLMFTCMGTFFNRISDPAMGGAYLTMLNTIMNLGMTIPQGLMFFLVDNLSYNVCENVAEGVKMADIPCPRNTQAAKQVNECSEAGGICTTVQDGFYITSYTALLVGIPMLLYFRRALPKLEALPHDSWRSKTVDRQA